MDLENVRLIGIDVGHLGRLSFEKNQRSEWSKLKFGLGAVDLAKDPARKVFLA